MTVTTTSLNDIAHEIVAASDFAGGNGDPIRAVAAKLPTPRILAFVAVTYSTVAVVAAFLAGLALAARNAWGFAGAMVVALLIGRRTGKIATGAHTTGQIDGAARMMASVADQAAAARAEVAK